MKKKKTQTQNNKANPMHSQVANTTTVQCPYPNCGQVFQAPLGHTKINCPYCNQPLQIEPTPPPQQPQQQPPVSEPITDITPQELSQEAIQKAMQMQNQWQQPMQNPPVQQMQQQTPPQTPTPQIKQQIPNAPPMQPQQPQMQNQWQQPMPPQQPQPQPQKFQAPFHVRKQIAIDQLTFLVKTKQMAIIAIIVPMITLFLGMFFLDLVGMIVICVVSVYCALILRKVQGRIGYLRTTYNVQPQKAGFPLRKKIQQPFNQGNQWQQPQMQNQWQQPMPPQQQY